VERNRGEVELFATPENPKEAAWLLPGAFVEVRMGGPLLKGVALLPEAALQDTQTVFVVDSGKLARRSVRLLGMEADKAIVEGLKAGEQVVRHRLAAPRPGQPVKILGSSG
jgi:multidrug efflux pump subunit AcrA (membrane-fusion protein)